MNWPLEPVSRKFCLTAVILPVGSANVAHAAGSASDMDMIRIPDREDSRELQSGTIMYQ
ncbi:MAG: hypothetical protein SWE60_06205 [Thermodesulfobacteriota bacterium]|nr:hypothetical protein [Thermodesulfobacteriota bacterium]